MKTIWGMVMHLECDYVGVYHEARQLNGYIGWLEGISVLFVSTD